MFYNKRIEKLEKELRQLQVQFNQLECPHANSKFLRVYFGMETGYGIEQCMLCDKTLKKYEFEKDFIKAHAKYLAKRLKYITATKVNK